MSLFVLVCLIVAAILCVLELLVWRRERPLLALVVLFLVVLELLPRLR